MHGPHWNQNLFNSELMTKTQVCVAATGRECFFHSCSVYVNAGLIPLRLSFFSTRFCARTLCHVHKSNHGRTFMVSSLGLSRTYQAWRWQSSMTGGDSFPFDLVCRIRSLFPSVQATLTVTLPSECDMFFCFLFSVLLGATSLYLPPPHSFISLFSGWYTARHDTPSDSMQWGKGWGYVSNLSLSLLSRVFPSNTASHNEICKTLSPL
jgi:hypothetical protein